jgi:hypothetical protein
VSTWLSLAMIDDVSEDEEAMVPLRAWFGDEVIC